MISEAEILKHLPELEALMRAEPSLRAAVASGDLHTIYGRLWWNRLLRRQTGPEVDKLLGEQRRFLKPVTKAPGLFTVNGIGAKLYGVASRNPDDGSYISTLFATFVFLPVFPLAQYLIAEDGGNAYRFYAKAPLASWARNWQLAVPSATALLIGGAMVSSTYASMYGTVHVVNALPVAVAVDLGETHAEVQPNSRLKLSVPRETVHVTVRLPDGELLEEGDLDVVGSHRTQAWNVAGAALLYREEVLYLDDDASPPDEVEPEIFCGQRAISLPRVDYAFRDTPDQVSMPKYARVVYKSHVDAFVDSPMACLNWAMERRESAIGGDLARTMVRLDPSDLAMFEAALFLTSKDVGVEGTTAWLTEHLGRTEDVETHRTAQHYRMSVLGQTDELRAEYAERLAQHPDSPDAHYLYTRLLPNEEARALLPDLVQRFPDHDRLRRALAWSQLAEHEWEASLAAYDQLVLRDPSQTFAMERATCLAGGGQLDEAAKILASETELDQDLLPSELLLERRLNLPTRDLQDLSPEDRELALARAGIPGDYRDKRARAALAAWKGAAALLEEVRTLSSEDTLDELTWILALGEARRERQDELLTSMLELAPYPAAFARNLLEELGRDELSPAMDIRSLSERAAFHLARARQPERPAEQARAERDLALLDDALPTVVSLAAAKW